MTGTVDDRYFEWLYELIGSVRNRNPARSHWKLARLLYTKEFVWLVANDDNRVEDGKDLRQEFIAERGLDEIDPEWLGLGCSMLEMLIALSRRAAFQADKEPGDWFWFFMRNLNLEQYTDNKITPRIEERIDDILDCVIYRTYLPDGVGGLFPLGRPETDQRQVEIWYQLAAHLLEVESL